MACSIVTTGSSGMQAMANAFQQGSGLCASSLDAWFVAMTFLGVFALATWAILGQYQAWTEDKDNTMQYWVSMLVALSFIPLAAILFLG